MEKLGDRHQPDGRPQNVFEQVPVPWIQPLNPPSLKDFDPVAPMLELRQVTHWFGQFCALAEINLQIYPGERVAVVGASGAGKSTLIRLLNGTLRPTQGEVHVLGRNLAQLSLRRLRQVQCQIGTVYQQFDLVRPLQVIHNVNAGHLGRWPLWKAALSLLFPLEVETAVQALAQVGIADKLYEPTHQLSGGQQQRVALARVLAQNPALILADEPISNLDCQMSQVVMDVLQQLSVTQGKTLVMSLHDLAFARSHCDRLIGLRQGRVMFDLHSADLTQYQLQALFNSSPDDADGTLDD